MVKGSGINRRRSWRVNGEEDGSWKLDFGLEKNFLCSCRILDFFCNSKMPPFEKIKFFSDLGEQERVSFFF